ncbi:MAG: hypothetical protein RJA10_4815 [Pseudomonadota bacterium]|jgi:hypothetical protein
MPGFSGQGKVLVGSRLSTGLPGPMRWLGNAPVFRLGQNEDTVERKESYTGQRLPNRRMTRGRGGELTITFDEWTREGAAWALLGATTTVAAGSAVTNWVAPTGFVAGDTILLPHKNVSAVSIVDSTGSPKTLPNGQTTQDLFAGSITLDDLTTGGAYVQPFKVSYTPGAVTVIGGFKLLAPEIYVRLDGINTDDNSRVIVDVFRSRLSPARQVDFISDDFADFELVGATLADLTRAANSAGGQFYSITQA